ncbi:MAG: acetyl-CoA hydrolase/transferase family protein [Lachnospiraceae bacterium]|jgi:4-hydroxybutyrate CoA-transferase
MKSEIERIYREKVMSADDAAKIIKSGDKIFLGCGASTPLTIGEAIGRRDGELEDVLIVSAFLREPMKIVNGTGSSFLNHTYFMGVQERVMNRAGLGDYTSMHLSESDLYFSKIVKPNIAVFDVTPPDEEGNMNLGAAGICLGKHAIANADTIICQVNKNEPWIFGTDNVINVKDVDIIVESDRELSVYPPLEENEETASVAEYILDMIPDGSTVQFGIGGVSNAVGLGLKKKNDLGGYTELMTDTMMELMELGVVNNRYNTYLSGKTAAAFALGTEKLYKYLDHNEKICFMPFTEINNPVNVAKNDNMISINTALQVDLFGQVNADNKSGDQFSATGGQLDFVRGAQMSKNGKSFIAMTSHYVHKGKVGSRIVAKLPEGTAVTTPRSDVQYLVTEYGCVNLKELSMRDRVRAIIELAAPEYRDELRESAREMKMYR